MIIKVIPGKWLYGFAKALSTIGYFIARKHRMVALESLKIAFGQDKSDQEIERIARDCFTFMAKSGAEVVFLMDRPETLKSRIRIIGKENLDLALSKGRGVVLVSAHFGNFPLLLARLVLAGYHTAGIMRPMRDERAEKNFQAKRKRLGIKTIYSQPRRACIEDSLRTLKNNEVLFVPIDQNFGTGGIFVDFFGRKAATATGPVVLAQRTGAAIIPCFIVRQKDDTHTIIIEPALELDPSSKDGKVYPLGLGEGKANQEMVNINIQKLTGIIESYIRKYPAQWGWIHRRWKSRPNLEGGG